MSVILAPSTSEDSGDSDPSPMEEIETLSNKLEKEEYQEEAEKEEQASKFTKQGYFEIKDGKKVTLGKAKWKLNWVVILEGTLHLYKNFEKTDPYCSLSIRELEISDHQEPARDFSISLKSPGDVKYLNASSASELNLWKELFVKAKALEPSLPPSRAVVPKGQRTQGPLFRIQKRVAGQAATTKMGETLLMKMFGEEMHHLLQTMKKVSALHNNKEVAHRVHKLLIKLTIKIAFQFEKKNLTVEHMIPVDRPLREALELLSKYYNARVRRHARRHVDDQCFIKVETLSKEAEKELIQRLQPYMTPKNLNNLHFVFDSLTNSAFLQRVFDDTEIPDELDEIDDAITAYTQFHF